MFRGIAHLLWCYSNLLHFPVKSFIFPNWLSFPLLYRILTTTVTQILDHKFSTIGSTKLSLLFGWSWLQDYFDYRSINHWFNQLLLKTLPLAVFIAEIWTIFSEIKQNAFKFTVIPFIGHTFFTSQNSFEWNILTRTNDLMMVYSVNESGNQSVNICCVLRAIQSNAMKTSCCFFFHKQLLELIFRRLNHLIVRLCTTILLMSKQ